MSKLNHEDFLKRFKECEQDKYFDVLSQYNGSRNKMLFKCKKCNNVFSCTANNITKKTNRYGCPKCAMEKRKNKLKGSIENVKIKIQELYPDGEYTLLSKEYINNKSHLLLRCNSCGNEFNISYVNICKGKGCKYCNAPYKHNSKGIKRIRKYLLINNISFEEEFIIPECKNIKPLPFDFKINLDDKNFFLIEFDGEFHERNVMNPKGLELQIKRDNIKNKFCLENNIDLLRINYREINNIESIIENHVKLSSTTIENTSKDGSE